MTGNMPNKKRKLSDSALQRPQGKKASFLTPQQGAKNGNTPKQFKQAQTGQTPKQQKAIMKTPNSHKGAKLTPKGPAQTPKGKAKLQQKDDEDDSEDDDDEEEEEEEEAVQKLGGLFKGQLAEDDDDDDEEDDDSEDEDEDDDDDDDQEQEGEEEESDEDDDENEEDNDENEEDDDEDDEEDIQPASKKARLEPQATPVKQKETPNKTAQKLSAGGDAPNKTVSATTKQAAAVDDARKDDRDVRTLFVKNLPGDCSVKMIKALSKDIRHVRLRINVLGRRKPRTGYAFVEFANEAAAEKNFKVLEGAVIRGHKLTVDYMGSKSTFKNQKKETKPDEIDPLRLYVAGLPPDVTEADLRQIFPKATEIHIPIRHRDKRPLGFGFINFESAELAKQYHDKCQDINIRGLTLVVLHAKKRRELVTKRETEQAKKQEVSEPPVKKAKVEKTAEQKGDDDKDSDDDDDDDDDEDDDNEDNDDNEAAAGAEEGSGEDDEDDDDDDEDDDDDDDDEDDDDD